MKIRFCLLVRIAAVLVALNASLCAKEYTNTSFYVSYDSEDREQYALVMPSVQKVYTHKAGDILNLTRVDGEMTSFPTYTNGELCFSELKTESTGIGGASKMAGNCYEVNFFYIQKKTISEGAAFILYYKPADKVYEGLAGQADTFKVVKEGETVTNQNSITGDDYTDFSFYPATAIATLLESSNTVITPPTPATNSNFPTPPTPPTF